MIVAEELDADWTHKVKFAGLLDTKISTGRWPAKRSCSAFVEIIKKTPAQLRQQMLVQNCGRPMECSPEEMY